MKTNFKITTRKFTRAELATQSKSFYKKDSGTRLLDLLEKHFSNNGNFGPQRDYSYKRKYVFFKPNNLLQQNNKQSGRQDKNQGDSSLPPYNSQSTLLQSSTLQNPTNTNKTNTYKSKNLTTINNEEQSLKLNKLSKKKKMFEKVNRWKSLSRRKKNMDKRNVDFVYGKKERRISSN